MRHSLKKRLVLLFVALAMCMAGAFIFGMQKALSLGWRDAARPLVMDYVDRLAADIGSPPSVEKAQALTRRMPVTVRISGPQVNWASHPSDEEMRWRRDAWLDDDGRGGGGKLLARTTADGHRIDFGLNLKAWHDRPRHVGWATLGILLLLTLSAWWLVRRLLRPLDDIRAGAQRFGGGDFSQPIPVTRRDELGELATTMNTMASSIHQMLEAKRSLLLAISHELRSPLTRARVNTELLPESPEVQGPRDALLRDLADMRDLVTDLLESERLGQGHAALQREPTEPGLFAREVARSVMQSQGADVRLDVEPNLPLLQLDRTRIRLLLRNLLDNALRHSAGSGEPPVLRVAREGGGVALSVRDFGPGVEEAALPNLAEPFWRPDSSRERATGGVGLGLYLCRLVARAHGGEFTLRNAQPGLEVKVVLASL